MIDSHADKYPNMALHLHSHPGQLTTQSGLVTHVITTHIVLTLVCLLGHTKPPEMKEFLRECMDGEMC